MRLNHSQWKFKANCQEGKFNSLIQSSRIFEMFAEQSFALFISEKSC